MTDEKPRLPEDETRNYFATDEHAGRVKYATEREGARLSGLAQVDLFHALSDAVGVLFAVCAFFRTIGLRHVAIEILKGALKFTRKG